LINTARRNNTRCPGEKAVNRLRRSIPSETDQAVRDGSNRPRRVKPSEAQSCPRRKVFLPEDPGQALPLPFPQSAITAKTGRGCPKAVFDGLCRLPSLYRTKTPEIFTFIWILSWKRRYGSLYSLKWGYL